MIGIFLLYWSNVLFCGGNAFQSTSTYSTPAPIQRKTSDALGRTSVLKVVPWVLANNRRENGLMRLNLENQNNEKDSLRPPTNTNTNTNTSTNTTTPSRITIESSDNSKESIIGTIVTLCVGILLAESSGYLSFTTIIGLGLAYIAIQPNVASSSKQSLGRLTLENTQKATEFALQQSALKKKKELEEKSKKSMWKEEDWTEVEDIAEEARVAIAMAEDSAFSVGRGDVFGGMPFFVDKSPHFVKIVDGDVSFEVVDAAVQEDFVLLDGGNESIAVFEGIDNEAITSMRESTIPSSLLSNTPNASNQPDTNPKSFGQNLTTKDDSFTDMLADIEKSAVKKEMTRIEAQTLKIKSTAEKSKLYRLERIQAVERARSAQISKEKMELERFANEKASEKAEKEMVRTQAEKADVERKAAEEAKAVEKAETDRMARRKSLLEAQKTEEERMATLALETERLQKEKAESMRIAAQKVEAELLAKQKAAEEARIAEEKRTALQKAEEAEEAKQVEEKRIAAQKEVDRVKKAAEEEQAQKEEEALIAKAAELALKEKKRAQKEVERITKEKARMAEEKRIAMQKTAEEERRIALQKAEVERVAKEKAVLEAKQVEEKRIAAQKKETERIAKEKAAEEARIAEEKRIAVLKAETQRIAKQKAADEEKRIATQKAEADRVAKRKAAEQAKRIAVQKVEADRLAKQKAEADRLAKQKAASEAKIAEEKRIAVQKEEADRRTKLILAKSTAEKSANYRLARIEAVDSARSAQIAKEKEEMERLRTQNRILEDKRITVQKAEAKRALKQKAAEEVKLVAEKKQIEKKAEVERILKQKALEEVRVGEEKRIAAKKVEVDRLAQVKIAEEEKRIAVQKARAKKLQAAEDARIAEEQLVAMEKAVADRVAKKKVEKEARIVEEQEEEADRLLVAMEKAEVDARIVEEKRVAAEKAEVDRVAKQKAIAEEQRIVAEKAEEDRLTKQKAIEEEKRQSADKEKMEKVAKVAEEKRIATQQARAARMEWLEPSLQRIEAEKTAEEARQKATTSTNDKVLQDTGPPLTNDERIVRGKRFIRAKIEAEQNLSKITKQEARVIEEKRQVGAIVQEAKVSAKRASAKGDTFEVARLTAVETEAQRIVEDKTKEETRIKEEKRVALDVAQKTKMEYELFTAEVQNPNNRNTKPSDSWYSNY